MKTECPHCHGQTDLTVEVPGMAAAPARVGLKWAVIGVFVVLALLGIAAPVLLKRLAHQSRGNSVQRQPASAPKSAAQPAPVARQVQNDFEIDRVTIQTPAGGSLTHATGTLRNLLSRQRFAVRVELECLDATGAVIATASDYTAVIEPKAQWQFRGLILKGKPASARITRITEQQ